MAETPAKPPLLAVRVLRPPVPLEVICTDKNRPTEIHPAPTNTPPRPRISSAVRIASGPWTLEEGWWSETPVAREYWDVELADGALYRIFRDPRGGEWFADGIYD